MIDNIHKLGRMALAAITVITSAIVVSHNPDIEIEKLTAIAAPAVVYIGLKWTGYTPK